MNHAPPLFGRSTHRVGLRPAPVLPTTAAELAQLGWDACDVILVTGDAYVDHPSFGAALIGRLLEAHGFRVGLLPQPDWRSTAAFTALGRPRLFFGVTAGNMDSLVNHYTAHHRPRRDDAYSPDGAAGLRPDRASIVYTQRLRQAFRGLPIILGGIEASLRRLAHYDFWSDSVRRSLLLDAKADLLLYGNAERAVVDLAHRLAGGEPLAAVRDLRGSVFVCRAGDGPDLPRVELPSLTEVESSKLAFVQATRRAQAETNPYNGRAVVQAHGDREVWILPPPWPLATAELDQLYELPFTRRPHPRYGAARIPAYEMIRCSVTICRGCFGGCTFCSIAEHEGRIIQSRSPASIAREVARLAEVTPGFTGVLSDLGGPSANMYRMGCAVPALQRACRRLSCLYPRICRHLGHDHGPLIDLYRQTRALPHVKQVLIASGVRHDLALTSPAYVRELVSHHVGGHLKLAPEHVSVEPLRLMLKPGVEAFERFLALFAAVSREVGKEQYVIPYWIAGHPGSGDAEMLELALWLRAHGLRTEQVQTFLPSPMSLATAMYHTGLNPLVRLDEPAEAVTVAQDDAARRDQKAMLLVHQAEQWPRVRRVLERLGRGDLVGRKPTALVPPGPGRGRRG